ncbi:MAG: UbiH/UbiF/VisC/COQ6 family ubiquinone biosynthesis hydroxylase [Pseudomonadota bacterium]
MTQADFDIGVVGAGLTGRLMALALAHEGMSVAIIDRDKPANAPHSDSRTTAIAYASARLLMRLGLWAPLSSTACPIHDIIVRDSAPKSSLRNPPTNAGRLHFPSSLLPEARSGKEDSDPNGALGYIIENTRLAAVFETAVEQSETITSFYGIDVTETHAAPGKRALTLSDGQTLRAPLLVACDGKFSALRRQAGLRALSWPYQQKALVFNIAHEKSHQGTAYEMFYPGGPFAILPMLNDQSSIVWTDNKKAADAYLSLSPDQFLSAVEDRVRADLGAISLASTPAAWPLTFHYVPNPIAERLVIAGDAAHTIHPIAGQGFNLAIKDIATLAEVVGEAARAGLDVGHGSVLTRYAKWRQFDTANLALGTDAINRLFSNDIPPLRWIRAAGLDIIQKIDPARVFFMRHAGADVGDLPSLMQPL